MCIPTTTQGMPAARAPSIADWVQLYRVLPALYDQGVVLGGKVSFGEIMMNRTTGLTAG